MTGVAARHGEGQREREQPGEGERFIGASCRRLPGGVPGVPGGVPGGDPGAPGPRGASFGLSAWKAVARHLPLRITSSPTIFGSDSSMFSTLMMRSLRPSSKANLAIWWNLPVISSFIGTFA